ncbi:Pentatricopeptide repeat-containing protein [Apostasia shenzhenica]|uniref:Pentatricopeptide repeat-containing protein n=1 Tax=Apostasia shenzhenica TaxID=1088818 RepID=A0A2I0AY02_9ASPA|nr:Pentatricopeptide repeat-containing protein [Apostasia shenzhenica]
MSAVSFERNRVLCALEECSNSRTLKLIMARAVVSGLWAAEPIVSARTVAACASFDLPLAEIAFAASPRPTAFSYNAMIRAHSAGPSPSLSFLLFSAMLRTGHYPDRFSFPFLLRAAARSCSPPSAVHAVALRRSLDGDVHVATSLLHAYASCGFPDAARMVFDEMPQRTAVTWCAIISCYAHSAQPCLQHDGLSLFAQMVSSGGTCADADAIIGALSCCSVIGSLAHGKALHALSLRQLPSISAETGTAIVSMYARSGSLSSATKVFDKMPARDSSTWTAMIGGLAMHGRGKEALALFDAMVDGNDGLLRPDSLTLTAVFHACSHSGEIETGMRIFNGMKEVHGVEATVEHYGAVVDMLGRAGRLEEAERVVGAMPFAPNRVIWGSLLHAYAVRGEVGEGEKMERRASEFCFGSDEEDEEVVVGGILVGLSNAFAGAGRWGKVGRMRDEMSARGVRKESAFSMVEVEGRSHRFLVGEAGHPRTLELYQLLNGINQKMMEI